MSTTVRRLLIVCDTPPIRPLDGHNRKSYELLCALSNDYDIRGFCYPRSSAEREEVQRVWAEAGVTWTFGTRRQSGRHIRALLFSQSLPSATRDFDEEARWVRAESHGVPTVLIIDFLTGAPLLRRNFRRGAILSGHDCMSYLFREEARHARGAAVRFRFKVREHWARSTERRFAHLAERVHVVSEQDAFELAKVNPAVAVSVIPIAGSSPTVGLKPFADRKENVIWGNLRSELIRSGLTQLLSEGLAMGSMFLNKWRVVGGVPEAEAYRLVPALANVNCCYSSRVDDISSLLVNVQRLCLPDIGGTGQKNRTIDGLAHGCCVIGLDEVFRGVTDDCAAIIARDFRRMAEVISEGPLKSDAELARRGEVLFQRSFSRAALRLQWRALIESCGVLEVPGGPLRK